MKNYIAVMQATAGNRIAKYQDFDTLAKAQVHLSAHSVDYPTAFAVALPVTGTLETWLVDTVAKTLTHSPDVIKLSTNIKQAIRVEGKRRLSAFMEDADFEVAASIHLLYIKANSLLWTPAEQSMADALVGRFTYVRKLYVTVTQAIAAIPGMTLSAMETFNPAADIVWPVVPV